MNTRILKAHVDAAEEVLNSKETIFTLKTTKNRRALAELIAMRVVTATDDKPNYVVVVTEPRNVIWIYGPYKSFKAATKAIQKGMVGTRKGKGRAGVYPLIPALKFKYLGSDREHLSDKEWD